MNAQSLADSYFRQFNGHTQVNATDLRSLRYPSKEQLLEMGRELEGENLDTPAANAILKKILLSMPDDRTPDPALLREPTAPSSRSSTISETM